MEAEKIIELSSVESIEPLNSLEDITTAYSGRCRIYSDRDTIIGCKNVSTESDCQRYAQYAGAWAYSWSPYYSC